MMLYMLFYRLCEAVLLMLYRKKSFSYFHYCKTWV